jgi:hypothetical protein
MFARVFVSAPLVLTQPRYARREQHHWFEDQESSSSFSHPPFLL